MQIAKVVALAALLLTCRVLGSDITNNNFKITKSPLSDVLSQQSVRKTFQDQAGLIWYLTQEGLHRYDGYQVRHFKAGDQSPNNIGHNNVREILQDHNGRIWIAMDGGGLQYYNNERSRFLDVPTDPGGTEPLSNNIKVMVEDYSGQIWLGYVGGTISLFDPYEGTFEHLETLNDEAEANGQITSFAVDGAQRMWIGTSNGGLIRYNRLDDHFIRFLSSQDNPDSLSANDVSSLMLDVSNQLWIGTGSSGLALFNLSTMSITRLKHSPHQITSLNDNSINTIYRDHEDRIWVGSDAGLNLYLGGGRFKHFTESNSHLISTIVLNIFEDRQRHFWIGTLYGLFTGFHSKFDIIDSKRGLPIDAITAFAEASNGDLWIGGYEGLFYYSAATSKFSSTAAVLPGYEPNDSGVMALGYQANKLWVGYRGHGAEKVKVFGNPETPQVTRFDRHSGLSNNAVSHIMTDTHGDTWISTFGGGLNRLIKESNTPTIFRHGNGAPNSISSDYIYKVTETRGGELLIATADGLSVYTRETNSMSNIKSSEGSDIEVETVQILSARESSSGDVWLGLQYSGLALWKFDDRKLGRNIFRSLETTPPFPSSTVYAIEEDSNGYLWMTTTNGMVRLDPATLKIDTFNYSDGLQDNEFNLGASFKDSQGRLYFGGNKGYNRFQPEDIVQESEPPPMVMTSIALAGEKLPFDPVYQPIKTLNLNHNDTSVNFEFSALDFTDPRKNRYKYQLNNFDPGWVDIGTRHNIGFTNLSSGIYQLHIKGANSDGVWNHEGLELTLKVHPAPWFSWWAFTCYGALIVWLLYFFRQYYDTYLLKEMAQQDAASLHVTAERAMDELQDQLEIERTLIRNVHAHSENTMGVLKGLLSKQAEAIGDESILELFTDNQLRFECLQQLEKNLYYMADRLEVNFRDFVEDLIGVRFSHQPLANVDIAVVNEASEIGMPASIAVPAAMITNELFCNSIKHAFDTVTGIHYIRIAMEENPGLDGWTLEVSDSGSGLPGSIDPNHPTTLGMELVLHFTRLLNAEITVTRHKGTHFSVNIPKPPPESQSAS